MDEPQTVTAGIQREVREIADVLAQQQGKTVREVWNEVLTLHRVRYETDVLRQDEG